MKCRIVAVALLLVMVGTTRSSAQAQPSATIDERIACTATGCFAGADIYEALHKIHQLGFQSVAVMPGPAEKPVKHSLGRLPTLNFYDADPATRQRMKRTLAVFKHISIHEAPNDLWQQCVDCAHALGAEIVTIHPRPPQRNQSIEAYLQDWTSQYHTMGDYAQKRGVKIGIENVGGPYDRYVKLIRAIKHPAVGATIDVGHCAFFDEIRSLGNNANRTAAFNAVIDRLIRDLAGSIVHFHVHNVRPYEQVDFSRIPNPYWKPGTLVDHRSIDEGEVDFNKVFAAVKAVGYRGGFEIELEEPDQEAKLLKSGKYLHERCKDQ